MALISANPVAAAPTELAGPLSHLILLPYFGGLRFGGRLPDGLVGRHGDTQHGLDALSRASGGSTPACRGHRQNSGDHVSYGNFRSVGPTCGRSEPVARHRGRTVFAGSMRGDQSKNQANRTRTDRATPV